MIEQLHAWFVEPFAFGFMQRALAALLLASVAGGLVGAYVVLRRLAFLGSAIAHTLLPGLVVAVLRGFDLFLGGLVAAIATALGIGWVSRRTTLREDVAIGVVHPAFFALGILLASRTGSFRGLDHVLFGSALGVNGRDLAVMAGATVLIAAVLAALHKELELSTVDERYARLVGFRPGMLRDLLLVLVAVAVVATVPAIGLLLTSAFLVTPAATAALVCRRLVPMLVASVAFAATASLAGLLVSYHLDVAVGAAVVVAASLQFLVVALARRRRSRT